MTQFLCGYAWYGLYIGTDGKRKVCCISKDKGSFEALDQTLSQSKQVRLEMLNGQKPDICSPCWKTENRGTLSMRQRSSYITNKHPITDKNPDPVPYIYDIRVGRVCNLACKMCYPETSSRWDELAKKIKWLSVLPTDADYNWFSNNDNQQRLRDSITKSISVYDDIKLEFAGGEPLLHKQCMNFIQSLDDNTKSKINLVFTTNATLIPNNFFESIKPFKSVYFNVSLDGIGSINDFIRYPSTYSETKQNFMRMIEHGHEVNFLSTVQVYNVWSFWEIAEMVSSLGRVVTYQSVLEPELLSVEGLPVSILDIGIQKAQTSISSGNLTNHNKKEVQSCISMLMNAKTSPQKNKIQEIISYTTKMEQGDKATFASCIPDLYKALYASG